METQYKKHYNLTNLPNLTNSFEQVINSLSLLKLQITEVQQKIKVIEKDIKKEFKKTNKINNSIKNTKSKKPSGFAKPSQVTQELCEFMNHPIGTELARTEVNKHLTSYIKLHNLQDQNNKSIIIPDNKLKNLLGISGDQLSELTFFTIQKYMNKHFISSKSKNSVYQTI
jgi:chromatin remodeling complex protein RSC6